MKLFQDGIQKTEKISLRLSNGRNFLKEHKNSLLSWKILMLQQRSHSCIGYFIKFSDMFDVSLRGSVWKQSIRGTETQILKAKIRLERAAMAGRFHPMVINRIIILFGFLPFKRRSVF